jgi:hypothetical protein|tara:strand:- start:933 stop:1175 length:243 start_codon:yes stop_codon:yes gene_type:complete
MPRKYNIKIIGEHRGPDENEFFPSTNPFNDQGMVEMFEYLESKYNFSIQRIEDWQIKNTVKSCDGGNLRAPFGFRIVEND